MATPDMAEELLVLLSLMLLLLLLPVLVLQLRSRGMQGRCAAARERRGKAVPSAGGQQHACMHAKSHTCAPRVAVTASWSGAVAATSGLVLASRMHQTAPAMRAYSLSVLRSLCFWRRQCAQVGSGAACYEMQRLADDVSGSGRTCQT